MDSDPILPPPVPTAAPSGFEAPAYAAPQVTVLDVVPPTKRSKKGWIVGGLALVAVVAGLVAFGLSRGGSDRESYSFAAAVDGTQASTDVAYEMTMSVMGMSIDVTGRMDTEAQLMSMTMDVPMLGNEIEMIIDGKGQKMYMDAQALGAGGEVPTRWASVDLSQVPNADQIFSGAGSNPLDMAQPLVGAEGVEEIGMEEFRGEQVKHFRVTVAFADVIAANPSLQDQLDQMEGLGEGMPEELVYDVYITEDNQLRRMTFELPVSGVTSTVEFVMTPVDNVEPIAIPAADEVTDITEMMSGAFG